MIFFIFNVIFGVSFFFFLKRMRQSLFLFFLNHLLPRIVKASKIKLVIISIMISLFFIYFQFWLITFMTALIMTIFYRMRYFQIENEVQPKKLILFFPGVCLVFFLFYFRCILFSENSLEFYFSLIILFDTFVCALYKIISQFLMVQYKEDFASLLMELQEIDLVLEVHKKGILKFVSHLDYLSDVKNLRPFQTIVERIKSFYNKNLKNFDFVYFYYAEKTILLLLVVFGLIIFSKKFFFEHVIVTFFAIFHIDWICFKSEKYEMEEKKKFLSKVFLMIFYKLLIVCFSIEFSSFFIGYFIFFTIENLKFHHAQKINTKKYIIHMTCALLFLVFDQRINEKSDSQFRIYEINVLIYVGNFFLILVKFIKELKPQKIIQSFIIHKYKLFSITFPSLLLEYFLHETAILISIGLTFIFTLDFFLIVQMSYILMVWILVRIIYENLKLNDFSWCGNYQKIKEKFQSFEKLILFFENASKDIGNLEAMDQGKTQNLVGLLLNFKKIQKNVIFHNYNKIGDFDKWIYGKIISPKLLITDERIIISGINF